MGTRHHRESFNAPLVRLQITAEPQSLVEQSKSVRSSPLHRTFRNLDESASVEWRGHKVGLRITPDEKIVALDYARIIRCGCAELCTDAVLHECICVSQLAAHHLRLRLCPQRCMARSAWCLFLTAVKAPTPPTSVQGGAHCAHGKPTAAATASPAACMCEPMRN